MYHGDKHEPTFGLDIQVFMDVIACGDSGRRTSLAMQITRFLADPATPPGEREQVLPVARRLAADEDVAVRGAFVAELSKLPALDADLLFTIVSDEEEIALPFLAATPALDSLRMLAILRAGGEARQAIIATRPDVSPEAVDVITREMSPAVNALLLENPAVQTRAPRSSAPSTSASPPTPRCWNCCWRGRICRPSSASCRRAAPRRTSGRCWRNVPGCPLARPPSWCSTPRRPPRWTSSPMPPRTTSHRRWPSSSTTRCSRPR